MMDKQFDIWFSDDGMNFFTPEIDEFLLALPFKE
jgi:hypothetical protein